MADYIVPGRYFEDYIYSGRDQVKILKGFVSSIYVMLGDYPG